MRTRVASAGSQRVLRSTSEALLPWILDSAEGAAELPNTLRTFFEIPADQTVVEPKYRTVEVSAYLNRGGSALFVLNKEIELEFKKPTP